MTEEEMALVRGNLIRALKAAGVEDVNEGDDPNSIYYYDGEYEHNLVLTIEPM